MREKKLVWRLTEHSTHLTPLHKLFVEIHFFLMTIIMVIIIIIIIIIIILISVMINRILNNYDRNCCDIFDNGDDSGMHRSNDVA